MTFFSKLKSNVIKWWQQVILPVFIIRYDNNVRAEQQPIVSVTSKTDSESADMEENVADMVQADSVQERYAPNTTYDDAEYARQRAEQLRREQERNRQQEIERLRREQQEKERIAAIMNANKVNVNAFIEEGREARLHEEEERKAGQLAEQEAENLRRAQEIIDRLNREAAEDEAKKEAEIAEAKEKAQRGY
ncbi:unknown [Clostridium sp. CAG:590]|nr:unknown [Clostridium sp. CAG:590]